MGNRLIIISESASFPWGMAAANRVRNLAKGLIMEGWNVQYVGLRGADIKKRNNQKYNTCGWKDDISYCYPGLFSVRSGSWWFRRLDDIFGCLFTILLLLKEKILYRVDAVVFYSRNEIITGFWIPFLHLLKIPVFLEMCEWPLAISETLRYGNKKAERFCQDIVPMADAVLPISTYINAEIKKMAALKKRVIPSFQIPVLIDTEIEIFEKERTVNGGFMLYCGSISYMDIAMIVVDIVFELKKCGINLPLKFTGKEDGVRFTELKSYAEQQRVLDQFEFTGFLEEEELFKLMQHATCLLAPLPDNLQSQSRFPTKIGYYLASATPMVTNDVGDVKLYLNDGVNAFVTQKCDVRQFVKKIITILNDPDLSRKVGLAGHKFALETFHYTHACKGLGDFISHVVGEYQEYSNRVI